MKRVLEGVAYLPTEMLVAPDALGKAFAGLAGPANFSITFPALPEDAETEGFFLEPPYATPRWAEMESLEQGWGYMGFEKTQDLPRPLESVVVAVTLCIDSEAPTDVPLASFAASFGRSFDAWYATTVEWLELWSGQILTKRFSTADRTTGKLWPVDSAEIEKSGWGLPLHVSFSSRKCAVNAKAMHSAFEHASNMEHPPAEWLLYLSAIRSHDPRQAIIEAETAAEVGMAHAIDDRFPALSEDAREKIIMKANGAVGLAELLGAIDGSAVPAVSLGRVKGQLAGPRNLAVHSGAAPSQAEVSQAREVAKSLLDAYSPLPGP
ncbi:hypothetical protein FQ154_09625 [Paeniglutamicibacter gangotriensis]|uniref:Uncharacterized protein n=1 Tax=Paeniglutamicibacter gangotriensis TaxID=254787 RepID=A0A5B0EEN7_9MICC|nr:hypothetical protein [Paeniglutamicibacter gangotriensis]KAA0977148.1 hypothetical protein FQ154_09625 [Paeniglutamicibacter gangotriensis]